MNLAHRSTFGMGIWRCSTLSASLKNTRRSISVTWYHPDGSVFTSIDKNGPVADAGDPLPAGIIAELSAKAGPSPAYLLREDLEGNRRFRLSGPIWVESFANDGLFDVANRTPRTKIELAGLRRRRP